MASALVAFLHFLAAFFVMGSLAIEHVLLRGDLTLQRARALQRADLAFGLTSGIVLIAGALRVIYFEKGADYYLHNVSFIAKISLFVIVGLLSIHPTVTFLSWNPQLSAGQMPDISPGRLRRLRLIVNLELGLLVLIIFCASLMAHGIGYVG